MGAALFLSVAMGYYTAQRSSRDAYFRTQWAVLPVALLAGTLFFWVVEGWVLPQAFLCTACTLAWNTATRTDWAPHTAGGVIVGFICLVLGVGLLVLFVLEVGKTAIESYEAFAGARATRGFAGHGAAIAPAVTRRSEPEPCELNPGQPHAENRGQGCTPLQSGLDHRGGQGLRAGSWKVTEIDAHSEWSVSVLLDVHPWRSRIF